VPPAHLPDLGHALGHLDLADLDLGAHHRAEGSVSKGLAGDHGGPSRDWLETEYHATDQSVITEFPGSNIRLVGSH
jgi:hypothetical protein